MKLIKCDRCGAVGVPEGFAIMDLCNRSPYEADITKELCVGCRRSLERWLDNASERPIGSTGCTPAPVGTFEWVLSRIRQGAPLQAFRRAAWPNEAGYLGMKEGKMMVLSAGHCIVGFVDGYDILAKDWVEDSE